MTAHEPFVVPPADVRSSPALLTSIETQLAASLAVGSPVASPAAVPSQLAYVTARLAIPRGVQCTFTQRLTAQSHASLALSWLAGAGANAERHAQLTALISRVRRYAEAVQGASETDVVLRRFVYVDVLFFVLGVALTSCSHFFVVFFSFLLCFPLSLIHI